MPTDAAHPESQPRPDARAAQPLVPLEGCGILPVAERSHTLADPLPDYRSFIDPAESDLDKSYRKVLARAVGIAAGALAVAGFAALSVATSPANREGLIWPLRVVFGVQVLLVTLCSKYVTKLPRDMAAVLLFAYSGVLGCTVSMLVPIFRPEAIAGGFLITSATFAGAALYALWSQSDLGRLASWAAMLSAGALLTAIASRVWNFGTVDWFCSLGGVVGFSSLLLYHAGDIEGFYQEFENDESGWKASVIGAVLLIVDSVNLYLLAVMTFSRVLNSSPVKEPE